MVNFSSSTPPPLSKADCNALKQAMEKACQEGMTAGAVGVIVQGGEIVFLESAGFACLEPERIPMTVDTHFDLASITKPVVTATLMMRLVEEGQLHLDDRISAFCPEFGAKGKEAITIKQCLTHTAGFPPFKRWFNEIAGKQAYWEAICQLELDRPPGGEHTYSDFGPITLGYLLEKVTGQPLDQLAQEKIFKPLGMSETGYRPAPAPCGPPAQWASLGRFAGFACTEYNPSGYMKCGVVHDENTAAMGGVAGHAGLFSTARDLAAFAMFLLGTDGKNHDDALKRATLEQMLAPVIKTCSPQQGLGWWINPKEEDGLGYLPGRRVFGHTGFTGPTWWMDRDRNLSVLLLANAVHPHRDRARRGEMRKRFFDEVIRIWYR